MKAHLLYVEDDESLSFVTKDSLEMQGYQVTYCSDGREASTAIAINDYDVCIFDVMLPHKDGFALAQEMRAINSNVPIIFLSAKSLKEDRIHGLKVGADDYLTKPFSIEELLLKIDIFLRRSAVSKPKIEEITNTFDIGHYIFDHKNLALSYQRQPAKTLTQKEGDLLKMLIAHKNEIVKRSELLENLWGQDDYFMGRSMDVFISRLRKYLSGDERIKIENIHGVGFKMRID